MNFLEGRLQNRDGNNLDFLRFLAAAFVVLDHCYPLLGKPADPLADLTGYEGFGQLGFSMFFFMSGLLITRSWESRPSVAAFAGKRFLRIYPGLLATSLFGVFVVGPLAVSIPLSTYFTRGSTYLFLINALWPGMKYGIENVFVQLPVMAVNGSLWTLPAEIHCYVAVGLCGHLGLLGRQVFRWVFAVTLGVFLWPYAAAWVQGVDLSQRHFTNMELCYLYFLLGAACYVYRRRLPVNRWLALLAVVLYLGTLSTGLLGYVVSFFSVPYLVLYAAMTPVFGLQRWSKRGDLSYGMYIYAFPIQQCLIYFLGVRIGVGPLFFSTLLLTMVAAYFSWHLVERPVIAWKWGQKRREPEGTVLPGAAVLHPVGSGY